MHKHATTCSICETYAALANNMQHLRTNMQHVRKICSLMTVQNKMCLRYVGNYIGIVSNLSSPYRATPHQNWSGIGRNFLKTLFGHAQHCQQFSKSILLRETIDLKKSISYGTWSRSAQWKIMAYWSSFYHMFINCWLWLCFCHLDSTFSWTRFFI